MHKACDFSIRCYRRRAYLYTTLLCMAVGIGFGVALHVLKLPDFVLLWIGLPGELFVRALNFTVVPLLASNVIASAAKLKPATQGKAALMALGYCVFMNACGSFTGLSATLLINPGSWYEGERDVSPLPSKDIVAFSDVFSDFFRNMVPDNAVRTLFSSTATTYVRVQEASTNATNRTNNGTTEQLQRDVGNIARTNVLGMLSSSLVIGLIAGSRLERTQPFISLAESLSEIMTILIENIIKLLPLAMISLVAHAVGKMQQLQTHLIALSLFVVTSLTFVLLLTFFLLPLVYAIFVRRNLFLAYPKFIRPVTTAFSATSSLVALPELFSVCDELGVDHELVRTIAPFLTSFNSNGSSAFIASAIVFVAQLSGHHLNPVELLAIGFLCGINVMALPAIPSSSIIIVFLLSRTFNIPEASISMLFVVEFIADRLRTVFNVLSHGTCILLIHYTLAELRDKDVNGFQVGDHEDGVTDALKNKSPQVSTPFGDTDETIIVNCGTIPPATTHF